MLLHKYQPINEYSLKCLNLKKNWASYPKNFNDPFEFPLRSETSITADGKIEHLNLEEFRRHSWIKENLKKLGIISYSLEENNILLWSHYAKNHTGMCLVFEVPNDLKNLYPVKYDKVIPQINLNTTSIDYRTVLLTKSNSWNYENEFRQICEEGGMLYDFPGELKEIIFGCQTVFKEIETVIAICDTLYMGIVFSKMFIQKDTFNLVKCTIPHQKGEIIPEFWNERSI